MHVGETLDLGGNFRTGSSHCLSGTRGPEQPVKMLRKYYWNNIYRCSNSPNESWPYMLQRLSIWTDMVADAMTNTPFNPHEKQIWLVNVAQMLTENWSFTLDDRLSELFSPKFDWCKQCLPHSPPQYKMHVFASFKGYCNYFNYLSFISFWNWKIWLWCKTQTQLILSGNFHLYFKTCHELHQLANHRVEPPQRTTEESHQGESPRAVTKGWKVTSL